MTYLKNNTWALSKFGIVCTLLFIFFTILARFLLPFGDEPDFTVRAPILIKGEYEIITPYNIFLPILKEFNSESNCFIDASATSLWVYIDVYSCREGLSQILSRIFLTIFLFLPIFFILIFRNVTYIISKNVFFIKASFSEFDKRLDALGISLLFPGMIYFSGILALEQLVLVLALLLVVFLDSFLLVALILLIVMNLDLGNSIVYMAFISILYLFLFLYRKKSTKIILVSSIFIVGVSLVLGIKLFDIIANIPALQLKVEAIQQKRDVFIDKHPVIARPIITFMTGVFMTPSGVKSVILYLGVIVGIIFAYRKSFMLKSQKIKQSYIYVLAVIVTILFFVFMLPDYSYAKYYIFMLPLIFLPIVYAIPKLNILYFVSFLSMIWLVNLFSYFI